MLKKISFNLSHSFALLTISNVFKLVLCNSPDSFFTSTSLNWTSSKDEAFDRNYFGVEYSPFDKLLKNGSSPESLYSDLDAYTKEDIQASLSTVASKFTNIIVDTFGFTIRRTHFGQKVLAQVAKIAAEMNQIKELPHPLRIMLRGQEENILETGIVAEEANAIFPGTVWALIISVRRSNDGFSTNLIRSNTLKLIKTLRESSPQMKIGLEIYLQRTEVDFGNDDFLLKDAVDLVDFMICATFTTLDKKLLSLANGDVGRFPKTEESHMTSLKGLMTFLNPNVSVYFLTGLHSGGLSGSEEEFQEFWYRMGAFAKKEKLLIFMYEGIDQPIRSEGEENSINSKFGWWQQVNNSVPPVYLEKVKMFRDAEDEKRRKSVLREENWWEKVPLWGKVFGGIFLALMAAIFTAICYFRRELLSQKKNILSLEEIEEFRNGASAPDDMENDGYTVVLRMPYNQKYELSEENFSINKSAVMGSGQSGIVFRGSIKDIEKPVAFKCTTYSSSVTDVKQLLSEIKILSYLETHENILCLLGAYTRKIQKGIIYVALEYCEFGSLESFLRKLDPKQLFLKKDPENMSSNHIACRNEAYVSTTIVDNDTTYSPPQAHSSSQISPSKDATDDVGFETFLLWSHQIASGMEFLSSKRIVHADLASRNVLLASPKNIKISDFGLSKKLYQDVDISNTDNYTPLPWRWMAPESLRNLVFSVETDVWSFGVTIWEIFSLAEVPYHGSSYNLNFVDRLEQGLRLPCAKFGNDLIHDKLLPCWSLASVERPSFLELKEAFRQLICELCENSTEL